MIDQLSSDGVPFLFLAAVFLYGAGLALAARDWPELAVRGTITAGLVSFTVLGYANELRVLDEPTVLALFWWLLLVVATILTVLRAWKWVPLRPRRGPRRLTPTAWPWPGRRARVRRP